MATAAGLLVATLALAVLPAAAKPQRIVSLNLCTDQLILLLADRQAVASVTYLALDPDLSYMAAAARGLHVNRGLSEDALVLDPDLVLAGGFTTRSTVSLLKRLGLEVLEVQAPDSLEMVRTQIRRVAEAVGEPGRGERLIARMDARIAAARATVRGRRRVAAVYHENSFTVGGKSLVDDIVKAAGFDNLAAGLGIEKFGYLALESLIVAAPELIIFGSYRPDWPSLAHQVLEHRALRAAFDRRKPGGCGAFVTVPTRLWNCGGPFNAEAVELLARQRGGPSRGATRR